MRAYDSKVLLQKSQYNKTKKRAKTRLKCIYLYNFLFNRYRFS